MLERYLLPVAQEAGGKLGQPHWNALPLSSWLPSDHGVGKRSHGVKERVRMLRVEQKLETEYVGYVAGEGNSKNKKITCTCEAMGGFFPHG